MQGESVQQLQTFRTGCVHLDDGESHSSAWSETFCWRGSDDVKHSSKYSKEKKSNKRDNDRYHRGCSNFLSAIIHESENLMFLKVPAVFGLFKQMP